MAETRTSDPKEIAEQLFTRFKGDCATLHEQILKTPNATARNKQLIERVPMLRSIASLMARLVICEKEDYKEAALDAIDLGKVYAGVDARQAKQDELISESKLEGEELGNTEFIVLELLKWFKNDFFKWVNTPELEDKSGGRLIGTAAPNAEERAGAAGVVEVYQYDDGTQYRFPRYNDPKRLLQWRKGRCGEWNMCFYQILRAMEITTRYIWNAEDHVWCEFYSTKLGRWIHLDSCEEAFDKPSLYNKGWGKKMSYCIAVGLDGVADVTRRYVVEEDKKLPRSQVAEIDLKRCLVWMTASTRGRISSDALAVLWAKDYFEDLVLRGVLQKKMKDEGPALPRQTGAGKWTQARGEDGI